MYFVKMPKNALLQQQYYAAAWFYPAVPSSWNSLFTKYEYFESRSSAINLEEKLQLLQLHSTSPHVGTPVCLRFPMKKGGRLVRGRLYRRVDPKGRGKGPLRPG